MKRALALLVAALMGAACSTNQETNRAASAGDSSLSAACERPGPMHEKSNRVIVFVWDGLRPDSVSREDTPNLAALRRSGVNFAHNHSTYPTFTMMNSAAFATGAFPGTTGFYGNTFYAPGASGSDSAGHPVDFQQPVFTEDYAILQDLDAYYENQLLLVGTLFQAAQAKGLTTAAVGKTGAAFLQDRTKGGFIVDEKMVWPLSLVQEIQAAGDSLPTTTPLAYDPGVVTLSATNGNPIAFGPKATLTDGVTSDPTSPAAATSPYAAANAYMMKTYLDHVLPKEPDLTLIWFRSPDSNEHAYGPGSPNYFDSLHAQDELLGQLQARLRDLRLASTTDVIVVSDHGHSTVAGPAALFPLRAIAGGEVSGVDAASGWSVSGDVRLADLLTRAGFDAYDGSGCAYSPVISGIKADGSPVYPTQTDVDGSVCGKAGAKYTTASFQVPASLPPHAVVIAANGGSDYLYVPDHDQATVAAAVSFLQSREEYGAVFVASRYGKLPGTLPLDVVHLENTAGRNPDIIASFNFDETAAVAGLPGTTFESMQNNRGMHGSFSPIDVHNTLIAGGPDFRGGMVDPLPTGNVDVAPTVAHILDLSLPQADGRALREALMKGESPFAYRVLERDVAPAAAATGLTMKLPTSPAGADVDPSLSTYTIRLHTKTVVHGDQRHTYFDWARAVRE
jgi:predicted AlkP superfamily pyrophosphatase or phosphodiesterase